VVFPTSIGSVPAWLDAINLSRYKPNFEQAALLEVSQLHDLSDERLQAAGVQLVGHRKRMLQAAKQLLPPAPPELPPPPQLPMEARMMDMDLDEDEEEQPRRRDRSQKFGIPAANAIHQPAAASSQPAQTPSRRSNSTSSIYISSTVTKPDTEEIVFCMAVVIHERIQQGEGQPSEVKQRFPFFSEDNNPLYAVPTERDNPDSGSDNSMKRARREVPTEDTIFHTIRSVFECAEIPAECLIVSLVYMERLIATAGCPILVTSWRPILLASLILAQKVWDDRSLHNVDFSVFCPMFTLKEINFLEKKFLELIDYDVSITASLYASYYFQLRTLCQRVDREFSLKPMEVEAAAKLEARGVATTTKLRSGAPDRRYQSANAINGPPSAGGPSNFLQKLFN